MCGRYSLKTEPEVIATLFGLFVKLKRGRRYNIAPTQQAPVVRVRASGDRANNDEVAPVAGGGGRVLDDLKWGLVPSWSKDPSGGARMINARAEGIADKPAFRAAFHRRRCLVPADGFYEWKVLSEDGKAKQPYYIHLRDEAPFAFAGLWEFWKPEGEEEGLSTFTIITTEPNDLMRPLHDRMPVIVDPADFDLWLDPSVQEPERLTPLLRPYPSEQMVAYPVSRHVNSPKNDDERCVQPAEAA